MGDGIMTSGVEGRDVGIHRWIPRSILQGIGGYHLLEKSLLVLEEAVVEGRKTFANIIKYIKMTASSNFGNVLAC